MKARHVALIVAFCFTAAVDAQKKDPYKNVDNDVRLAALRLAQVWMPGDIRSRDMRLGPQEADSFRPEAVVNCDYIEEKQTGTPKFDCAISGHKQAGMKGTLIVE